MEPKGKCFKDNFFTQLSLKTKTFLPRFGIELEKKYGAVFMRKSGDAAKIYINSSSDDDLADILIDHSI